MMTVNHVESIFLEEAACGKGGLMLGMAVDLVVKRRPAVDRGETSSCLLWMVVKHRSAVERGEMLSC